jgi:Domain of unknown function (DUF4091)
MNQLYRKFKVWVWILLGSIAFSACSTTNYLVANKSAPITSTIAPTVKPQLAKQPAKTAMKVWVSPSLDRVGRTDSPKSASLVQLNAAKGEYESFQIIVSAPTDGLKNVNITVSDLIGVKGQVIPSKNITLYREHYVNVRKPSPQGKGTNQPLGSGWYADGLIPFIDPFTLKPPIKGSLKAVPFNVAGKQNQPIWGDIFVPRKLRAGKYQGTYTVTADGTKTQGKIQLNVWNFELPLKPSLHSAFEFWTPQSRNGQIELLKHKLMARRVKVEDERELISKWGLNSANLDMPSEMDIRTCKISLPPSVEKIRAAAKRRSPELFLYNYTADEIDSCPSMKDTVKKWARNLQAAGVYSAISMKPTPDLFSNGAGNGRSAVDIWVLLPTMYDAAKANILQVMKRGNRVWSYNALVQDDYSPKWEIDFKPINYRIQPGFISQSLGLTGLLYWQNDLWTKDPWNDIQTYVSDGQNFPGEGMLFYPGAQVGTQEIVPSIRVKALRDGVEDYEYVQILKGLGRKDLAITLARKAGRDWRNWTQDTKVIESVRVEIGREIHKLKSKSG